MAKKKEMQAKIKLQCPGGQATPAPPVGPALGQHGVPIHEFVTQFNERTKENRGLILPVEITVYTDRTFDFIIKSPPASVLLKKMAKVESGAKEPNRQTVGKVTRKDVAEIVRMKQADLNARTPEAAARIIEGTAHSMGIEVTD